jgi:hypothetical protein
MNICIYSNCQGLGIKFYLEKKLNANYYIIENYIYFNNTKLLPIDILEKADILIFQFTNASHGICSTDTNSNENIFNYTKKDCIKIGIPSIFQSSFWPVIPGFGSCRDGHSVIKELKDKYNLHEIYTLYDENKIDFKLKERFINCENHTKEIEEYYIKNTYLKIIPVTNFIRQNYKNYKLFFTHCHPTSYIFIHISNEIIKIINKELLLNITNYENIFSYKLEDGCIDDSWADSKYIQNELEIKYINNNINDDITKNYIKEIYNNI